MKKSKLKIITSCLLAVLLCFGYLATPIRPAIAAMAANQYIKSHYQQYDFAPAHVVDTGYRQVKCFKWITNYGTQSYNKEYIVYIKLNGLIPFIVQESKLLKI